MLIYALILTLLDVTIQYEIGNRDVLTYTFPRINSIIYLLFSIGTLVIITQNFSRISLPSMRLGLMLFSGGQIVSLLSNTLRSYALAENTSTVAALLIIYGVFQLQVIKPLIGRTRQIEVIQDVGQSITDAKVDDVLQTIVRQAADLLDDVDASAIYLREHDKLVLKQVYNLPDSLIGTVELALNEGVVGTTAATEESMFINNYQRDWKQKPDIPYAFEIFGGVASVPLVFNKKVVGVLLVIKKSQYGQFFDYEDLNLLKVLAPLGSRSDNQ